MKDIEFGLSIAVFKTIFSNIIDFPHCRLDLTICMDDFQFLNTPLITSDCQGNGLKLLLNLRKSPIYSKIFATVQLKLTERSLTAQAASFLDEFTGGI